MGLPVLFFYGFAFVGLIHAFYIGFWSLKNDRKDNFIVAIFLAIQSIIIFEYVFFWSGIYTKYTFFQNVSLPLLLMLGPLLFIYLQIVFDNQKKIRQYLWHFIPSFLCCILLIPFYKANAEIKLAHHNEISFLMNLSYFSILIACSLVAYFVVMILTVIKEKHVGHIDDWQKAMVYLFGLYAALYVLYQFASVQSWYSLELDYLISLSSCLSILAIIYMSLGSRKIFEGYRLSEAVSAKMLYSNLETEANVGEAKEFVKYKNSGLTDSVRNQLYHSLLEIMRTEKLYTQSDLTLELLAEKLNTERHHLSQVINQNFGLSFFELINMFRIEEAKLMLRDKKLTSYTIIEIAYQVGYNTKNTFNSAFKRIVGVVPSEFRNNLQDQN